MTARLMIGVAACLTAMAPSHAQDADFRSMKNVEAIDRAFRNFGKGCGSLGFTPAVVEAPSVVQKRMYAYLLLKSEFEASAIARRWSRHMDAIIQLGDQKYIESTSARAGDALAAAEIDPATRDQAKKIYIEAYTSAFRNILQACTEVVGDPFLGPTYLSGAGSLDGLAAKAAQGFEEALLALGTKDRR